MLVFTHFLGDRSLKNAHILSISSIYIIVITILCQLEEFNEGNSDRIRIIRIPNAAFVLGARQHPMSFSFFFSDDFHLANGRRVIIPSSAFSAPKEVMEKDGNIQERRGFVHPSQIDTPHITCRRQ